LKPKYLIGSILFCLLTWALSGIWGCNGVLNSSDTKPSQPFRNLGDSAHYVGITACKGCHSDKHATFIETGMGQSFHLAERKYSKADFNNVKPVYDKKTTSTTTLFGKMNDCIFRNSNCADVIPFIIASNKFHILLEAANTPTVTFGWTVNIYFKHHLHFIPKKEFGICRRVMRISIRILIEKSISNA